MVSVQNNDSVLVCTENKATVEMTTQKAPTSVYVPIKRTRFWDKQRTQEEINRINVAYAAWMRLFPKGEHQSSSSCLHREFAWCSYVDARDNLPEGTTWKIQEMRNIPKEISK